MCSFCGSTEQEKKDIRAGLTYRAEELERFAGKLSLMAEGRIKPHTKESGFLTSGAHNIIRFLVDEFM